MKLLDEIRQQPEHIRHIFMWTLVVITFSAIALVWVQRTGHEVVALLHSGEQTQNQEQTAVASSEPSAPSPFAVIYNSFKDLTANISSFIRSDKTNALRGYPSSTPVPPQKLPIK